MLFEREIEASAVSCKKKAPALTVEYTLSNDLCIVSCKSQVDEGLDFILLGVKSCHKAFSRLIMSIFTRYRYKPEASVHLLFLRYDVTTLFGANTTQKQTSICIQCVLRSILIRPPSGRNATVVLDYSGVAIPCAESYSHCLPKYDQTRLLRW